MIQDRVNRFVRKWYDNLESKDDFGADGEEHDAEVSRMQDELHIKDFYKASRMFDYGLHEIDRTLAAERASKIRNETPKIPNYKLKNQLRAEGFPTYTLDYAVCVS